jgi:predicted enzyme related to lactoylglutathione lyase
MKKTILFTVFFIIAFFLGFFTRQIIPIQKSEIKMKRVTGIGGIFFKCKDPEKLKEWYSKHLGFNMDQYGTSFGWRNDDDPSKYGSTQWSPFPDSTKYFDPSVKEFMVNYRVKNLEDLVKSLKEEGVTILDPIECYDYGKFVHILDNEGNKIELWEPVD